MPQDTLFPTTKRVTGVRVGFDEEPTADGQVWLATLRLGYEDGTYATVYAERWSGYMLDLATTLAEDAVAAFFFGDHGDVGRAGVGVGKVARAHRRRHERL